jgi:N-acetylmuramic acid 6-phosphate etherase
MPRTDATPATEKRLPASRGLHRLPALGIARLMNREDRRISEAVRRVLSPIARAAELAAGRLRAGGRLIYVGAGSSGRLAALDAAELPPTFGIRRRRVKVLVAGGARALASSAERAEDDARQGRRRLAALARARDVVIGVAASGRTPFTVAALEKARDIGCATIAVTAVSGSPLARAADVAVVLKVGAEVLTGSTRLKAGTATKMALNMISTIAMVRLGYVWSNLMVDMPATNAKLRRRARRIVMQATGATEKIAASALKRAGGNARTAIVMVGRGLDARQARRRLREGGGDLDAALRGSGRRARTPRNRAPADGRKKKG